MPQHTAKVVPQIYALDEALADRQNVSEGFAHSSVIDMVNMFFRRRSVSGTIDDGLREPQTESHVFGSISPMRLFFEFNRFEANDFLNGSTVIFSGGILAVKDSQKIEIDFDFGPM
jgi:hypothetical protein